MKKKGYVECPKDGKQEVWVDEKPVTVYKNLSNPTPEDFGIQTAKCPQCGSRCIVKFE